MPFRMFGEFRNSCNVRLTSIPGESASAKRFSEKLSWSHDGEVSGAVGGNASGIVLSLSLSKILLSVSSSMVELESIGDFSSTWSNKSSLPASDTDGGSFKHEGDEKAKERSY